MSFVEEVNEITFEPNRWGFICALSRKESTSDLRKNDNFKDNKTNNAYSKTVVNPLGYMGYFQFGRIALQEVGYRDENGNWTGVDGAVSQEAFLASREIQIKAMNKLIDANCKLLRNNNFNEFYGQFIKGVEITESGLIAGAHLVGFNGIVSFLNVSNPKLKKGNEYDGNKVHVSKYIQLFKNYDLETCCPRKIKVTVKNGNDPLIGAEVVIKSSYKGVLCSTASTIKYKTDKDGKLPVIVRHPDAKVVLTVQGKDSEDIIQAKDTVQSKTLNVQGIVVKSPLASPATPEQKPQSNRTPQELREENAKVSSVESKDVTFNIKIVEGDSNKAITNMRFYLTYKGNIKEHKTDGSGVRKGIVAESGRDIEVSVAGSSGHQKIFHFTVNEQNQEVIVKLPVQSFALSVSDTGGRPVPNTLFSIFYRGREIQKYSNHNGLINLKMLIGFVYGFGIKGNILFKSRVDKSIALYKLTISAQAVKVAKAPERPKPNVKSDEKKPTDKTAEKPEAKKEQDTPKKRETHTEKSGAPLTVVGDQSAISSDTTRYHIYHDGKIKRENKAATGYAEFIYYEANGTAHNLGKCKYTIATRWNKKDEKGTGNVYLVDVRKLASYRKGAVGYKMLMNSAQQRYYLAGIEMAAFLGALCKSGYDDISFNGFSTSNGSPGESSSHINGVAGDIRYLRTDKKALAVLLQDKVYDHVRTLNLVKNLILFGWGKSKLMISEYFTNSTAGVKSEYIFPKCFQLKNKKPRHNNHLHLQGLSANLEDI